METAHVRLLKVLGYVAAVGALFNAIFEVVENRSYSEHTQLALAADAVIGIIGGAAILIGNALQGFHERLTQVEIDTKRTSMIQKSD